MAVSTAAAPTGSCWLAAVLISSFSPLHAACPPPDFSGSGDASFYAPASETNSCNLPFEDGRVVALPAGLWAGSAHCGECLAVTGPEGTVVVQVVDQCPDCPPTRLDLSTSAFDEIGNVVDGVISVNWSRVECPVTGPARFRFVSSNPFFLEVQASNIRHGVTSIAYKDGVNFVEMTRQNYNRFQGTPGGAGLSDVTIKSTSVTGESMEAHLGDPSQSLWINGPAQFQTCIDDVFDDGFEDP